MRKFILIGGLAALALLVSIASLGSDKSNEKEQKAPAGPDAQLINPLSSTTSGSVSVGGKSIDYSAVAGTLVLHGEGDKEHEPTVSMFYTAYFKKGADAGKRPITFVYNGGPGSATVWLHMGAFGPRRIVTPDHSHAPAAPYAVVNNDYSLLDASDLVFIDMPGAGFSRLIANDKDVSKRAGQMKARRKEIYSVDGDAMAFAQFIQQFLSTYGRWNSPKYLFGESYGTTRSAVLVNLLENRFSVDLNGVILLSQVLDFDLKADGPERNPGQDMPYILALPSFAAVAWYHHKLPNQTDDLKGFLAKVEQYAIGEYTQVLRQGAALSDAEKHAAAEKLHEFTGLPVDYLVNADLRVSGRMFEQALLNSTGETTGRLDARFRGASMDPMEKAAQYDPQSAAIGSAYVAAFNDYVRKTLKFGDDMNYRLRADMDGWDDERHGPFSRGRRSATLNVMGDLAMAMKANANLKVMLNGGYFDLATPFFTAQYEMAHLPMPASLQKNISYQWYMSGHMVYVNEPSLNALHNNVAQFIESTDNVSK
jgi:carboxypeptidase C (cathepsin A)